MLFHEFQFKWHLMKSMLYQIYLFGNYLLLMVIFEKLMFFVKKRSVSLSDGNRVKSAINSNTGTVRVSAYHLKYTFDSSAAGESRLSGFSR